MSLKKYIIFIFLFLVGFISYSQNEGVISGKIQNNKKQGIVYATLYNLTQKTSCITNLHGAFILVAAPDDVVSIRHLNYLTKEVKFSSNFQIIVLEEKDFKLGEVLVSPKAAFDLFNTACQNTWKTFKDENITRAYCKVVRKNGSQLSQTVDLDLDIVQKKQNSFKKGEKIIPYKIQERTETDTTAYNKSLYLALNLFYPLIHQIYWIDLPNQFNYYKIEDDNYIKLYLISKQTYYQKCNIEVSIQKADTVLHSFAMVKKDLVATKQNFTQTDTFHIQGTNHFIGYNYTNDFGYLSTYYQSMQIQDPEEVNNHINISQQLKTTNNGTLELKKRPNRRRIFNNSFSPTLITNRYKDEFWKHETEFDIIPYNFDGLANIKMDDLN